MRGAAASAGKALALCREPSATRRRGGRCCLPSLYRQGEPTYLLNAAHLNARHRSLNLWTRGSGEEQKTVALLLAEKKTSEAQTNESGGHGATEHGRCVRMALVSSGVVCAHPAGERARGAGERGPHAQANGPK